MLGLFAAAFAVRIAIHIGGMENPLPDERDYTAIASSLANGQGYSAGADRIWPEYFRAPGIPYLLSGVSRLGLSWSVARWILASANSLLAPILFCIGLALAGRRDVALLLGLVGCLHPEHARCSFEFVPDALATTVAAGAILAVVGQRSRDGDTTTNIWGGCLLGAAACLRSNMILLWLPVLGLWTWRAFYRPARRSSPALFVGVAAILATVLPAVALRSLDEGRILFLTDAGSEVFWRGNNEHTLDYLRGGPADVVADYKLVVGDRYGAPGAAGRAFAAGFEYIRRGPLEWLALKSTMLYDLWRPWPTFIPPPVATRLTGAALTCANVAKIGWVLLTDLLLVVVAVRACRIGRDEPALLLLAMVLVGTVFGVVCFPDHRYRMPIDIALAILAVRGASLK